MKNAQKRKEKSITIKYKEKCNRIGYIFKESICNIPANLDSVERVLPYLYTNSVNKYGGKVVCQ